jgi:threonine dehydrogenase-like Zn-dependent dehydrogenase
MATDANIPSLSGELAYPLKYGYAWVGRVIQTGARADPDWQDRLVFSFHPHESAFNAHPNELITIPDGMKPEAAVFLPNMETAVNLVMDGAPIIGEQALILGQGVVGLLTTSLLSCFPLDCLFTLDRYPFRRRTSLELGAQASFDPGESQDLKELAARLPEGADLAFELSGSPAALDQAIGLVGYAGRIVVGSWYGAKRASLDLGGSFHRSRIQLIASQVSTLSPQFSGRWNKSRRFQIAWEMIRRIDPARLITHRIPFEQVARAYQLLEGQPQETLQVVLTYGNE